MLFANSLFCLVVSILFVFGCFLGVGCFGLLTCGVWVLLYLHNSVAVL